MTPYYEHEGITIFHGDCLEALRELASDSVDACITDPPYELGFMGKKWDSTGIANSVDLWREVLRVLKPGSHLAAFGGTRTYHRMACAIEDAGFEIRDSLHWIYGSGFPKSLDVSKAIDKTTGAERRPLGLRAGAASSKTASLGRFAQEYESSGLISVAELHWQGYGTALKPAHEPIVLARKPLSESTVAANCLKHGTGAVNIDGCRIPSETLTGRRQVGPRLSTVMSGGRNTNPDFVPSGAGRWPSNILLSLEAAAALDEQSGNSVSSPLNCVQVARTQTTKGAERERVRAGEGFTDSGGASRFFPIFEPDYEHPFFYCGKASGEERQTGLDCIETITVESAVWDKEGRKVTLLVDTAQSPVRVIAACGTRHLGVIEWNTILFGNEKKAQSLRALKYTIKTKTSSTTPSKTLNFIIDSLTSDYTEDASTGTASNGNHVVNVELLTQSPTTMSELTQSPLGVALVALPTQLRISAGDAKPVYHPTVKPLKLMQWLVRLLSREGALVLDPFCGSGTTAQACATNGRRVIAIDKELEYVELTQKRATRLTPNLPGLTGDIEPESPLPTYEQMSLL